MKSVASPGRAWRMAALIGVQWATMLPAQASTPLAAPLGGTVMVDPSEKLLPNAEILFTKLGLTARSDSAGNFLIAVLLNGNVMYQSIRGHTRFDVNSVPVDRIISADFFTAAQTPAENRTEGAQCGTLQIVTRGR